MSEHFLSDLLIRRGLVDAADMDEVLASVGTSSSTVLQEVLLDRGLVTDHELLSALSEELALDPIREIRVDDLDPEVMAQVPLDFLRRHLLLPFRGDDDESELPVAVADPLTLQPLDDLRRLLGRDVTRRLASPRTIQGALTAYLESRKDLTQKAIEDLADVSEAIDLDDFEASEDLLDSARKAPVIKLVNTLIFEAMKARASDIHVEPYEKTIKVRYRIDGVLYDAPSLPKHVQSAMTSRVKILANLNIAETRLPQDGRISIVAGERKLDIRVSVLPTAFGERIVMRLLDKTQEVLPLGELGFGSEMLKQFQELVTSSYGIILVTGPTGSGKSTTLYSALTTIRSSERNILTVEDPIENHLKDISQIQVKPKIGFTFAEGLRSILRQDPDVIMVGEIRDGPTAEIAVQASLTGHLVFSTLHTNDAASAVTRLIDMGVEPYLIASSVIGILAQRLVRVLCSICKRKIPVTGELREAYDLTAPHIYEAVGCESCRHTGYAGRIGIFELLRVDDTVREYIVARKAAGVIKSHCIETGGMITLRRDGLRLTSDGLTTLEEVARVAQT